MSERIFSLENGTTQYCAKERTNTSSVNVQHRFLFCCWPGSTQTNETPFNVALDTDLAFFKHLQTRPDHLHKYTEYQRAVASTEGLDLRHVVNGYDWAALDTATVVDVCVPILWS